jgi:threonine synthase
MTRIDTSCLGCGRTYPLDGVPYRCPVCGGLYDMPAPLPYDPSKIDPAQPGIWRFRESFGLPDGAEPVSLGEGNTPLVWAEAFGREVAFKCEYLNPTGSFKDRGSSVIGTFLRSRGVTEAVEDSSGNAGASFAAYAARAGFKARIFVPASAAGPKRSQIEAYGAELVSIEGSRADVAAAVRREADAGAVYASHAWLPFNLPGYATAAYEIVEGLGRMPGSVVVPAGQGGLLLGLYRGFDAIHQRGPRVPLPKVIGVQAAACAPLVGMLQFGAQSPAPSGPGQTLAEGVRIADPLRAEAILRAVKTTGGTLVSVEEPDILPGRDALARRGLYVEPTSALVWNALQKTLPLLRDPVVVILTGVGLKFASHAKIASADIFPELRNEARRAG